MAMEIKHIGASVRARLLSHQHSPRFSRSPVWSLATLR